MRDVSLHQPEPEQPREIGPVDKVLAHLQLEADFVVDRAVVTRGQADEIVDRCYHDSHMYVGEDLWRCDQCGEVIRYIDDPNGNITLTELHPYKNRKVRTEVVVEGRWPS